MMKHSGIAHIGVVVVSDRASAGIYEDLGGPEMQAVLSEFIASGIEFHPRLVPDEQPRIEAALDDLARSSCCLIVTTGGTGPSRRDVTVEATESFCQKLLPGFGELMRQVSLAKVPTAILSRQTAGVHFASDEGPGSLVLNLPGSPKAIRECLEAVFPAIPYCIDLIGGPYIEANEAVVSAFRPKKKSDGQIAN